MAARLMCRKSRLVAYLPNLKSVVRHFRAFSSYDESKPHGSYPEVVITAQQTDLPDPHLGPLGPPDHRFPLPGMTGPAARPVRARPVEQPRPREIDLLTEQQAHERHASVLTQFINTTQEMQETEKSQYLSEPQPSDHLECVAQDCPQLIRRDFRELFPDRDLDEGPLTVITISQKTDNDMTGWSPDVEVEREQLLEHFISGAEEMCSALHKAGYWADFVDPSSGRPYLGAYTNATFFETDERYRNFGFDIDDLGCCKVIRHHLWGSHSYVGAMFTNAPYDHPILVQMTKKVTSEEEC